ncbi:TetR/AcrR family transcriptional regulator [Xanthomonas codiaei]|uniref:TetR family transcriptional regulator n=1 Tax=Xanthomonas codiaei TaxID=56463 RepID=A0A2S7CKC6_9XANT|nr:TetR/AcrR family transcriptional regulator [Xanthomonas codiaei]MCC8539411.1 TetR/AcrR family transcriptional regulator [Xanthomonas codiaei]PPU62017.1 TetR family transcriptional regulator [Xanthomonas codiaei]
MKPRRPDVQQRVVSAAAEMLAQHGLNATSIREMSKRAQAPLGSTYHHFPGGKQQVIGLAVEWAGAHAAQLLDAQLQDGLRRGVAGFMAAWRARLLHSEFRAGCPVLAAAVEEPIDAAGRDGLHAAAAAFALWEMRLANAAMRDGVPEETARDLAALIIASMEGAVALCRAKQDIADFDRVARQLARWLELALARTSPQDGGAA